MPLEHAAICDRCGERGNVSDGAPRGRSPRGVALEGWLLPEGWAGLDINMEEHTKLLCPACAKRAVEPKEPSGIVPDTSPDAVLRPKP